ncbi:hypothetical protein BD779DRAFT_647671 [Infundibulicybe gibba]|nr:hypothetical protein BD779DRAFT_647671 [Infundibulicybe gibba]
MTYPMIPTNFNTHVARNVQVVGGWTQDILGNWRYIETGRIEEVCDDAPGPSQLSSVNDSPSTSILDARDLEHFMDIITEPLPEHTTPPPCPSRRRVAALPVPSRPMLEPHELPSCQPIPSRSLLHLETMPTRTANELESLVACLASAQAALTQVGRIHSNLLTTYYQFDACPHVNLCSRINENLTAIITALSHHPCEDSEQRQARTSFWSHKHQRLSSLQRTLESLITLADIFPLSFTRSQLLFSKLKEHNSKLSDIVEKLAVVSNTPKVPRLHAKQPDSRTHRLRRTGTIEQKHLYPDTRHQNPRYTAPRRRSSISAF